MGKITIKNFSRLFRLLKLVRIIAVIGLFNPSYQTLNAQQRTISGTVTGTDGNDLPGVLIIIQGTTVGTLTDTQGKYTLQVPPSAKILIFSFVGMVTQEVSQFSKCL